MSSNGAAPGSTQLLRALLAAVEQVLVGKHSEVELAVIVETRGPDHRDQCLRALREQGLTFTVQ